MKQSAEALFKLLRIALGNEFDYSLPNSVNWKKVIDLSIEQGVAAIAVDGLQKIYDACPEVVHDLDKPELEDVKYDWFGYCLSYEADFEYHAGVIEKLRSLYANRGIKMLVLKGQSLGKYYPIPTHRPSGDIDVYLFDKYDDGNVLMESIGIDIDYHNKKHSVCVFDGITIENHKTLLDVDDNKVDRNLETILHNTSEDALWMKEGYYVLCPQDYYIFLLRHLVKHFESSDAINFRQLMDFGLFLGSEKDNIDLGVAKDVLNKYHMCRLNDIFISLAMDITGIKLYSFICGDVPSEDKNRVLDEILKPNPNVENRTAIGKLILNFSQLWKYRLLPDSFKRRLNRILLRHLRKLYE